MHIRLSPLRLLLCHWFVKHIANLAHPSIHVWLLPFEHNSLVLLRFDLLGKPGHFWTLCLFLRNLEPRFIRSGVTLRLPVSCPEYWRDSGNIPFQLKLALYAYSCDESGYDS